MDYFGVIILICLFSSMFLSLFLFNNKLKEIKLNLRKTKILYSIISFFIILISIFLVVILIDFVEIYLIPHIKDYRNTIIYRTVILFNVILLYFIFQYITDNIFLKKINKKYKINEFEKIGINEFDN